MISLLNKFYYKQSFFPNVWGVFINPFYFARKGLLQGIKKMAHKIGGVILDVGCGTKPYAHLFSVTRYLGLEVDTPENRKFKKADYFYDGKHFPFDSEYFDSVVSSQVFEHVFNPDKFLTEVKRVMKPGGMLLLSIPFLWDEHEQPYDFARYSSFGMRHLLVKHGFTILEVYKSVNDIRVIFQVINMYLYKITLTKNFYCNAIIVFFLMAPFNILGEILFWVMPKNNDLYLDNIILAQKIKSDHGKKV